MKKPDKFLSAVNIYLISHAGSSLNRGVLPVILPICLLGIMPPSHYAALLVIGGLCQMVAVPILSPASDRFGSALVLIIGECLYAGILACALFLVTLSSTSLIAWAAYFAASGIAAGLILPAQGVIVQHLVHVERLERAMGWQAAASNAGRLAGPLAAGVCLTVWSPQHALQWLLVTWLLIWVVHVSVLSGIAKTGALISPQRPHAIGVAAWWADIHAGARARWLLLTERWLLIQAAAELFLIVPAFGFCLALAVHKSSWPASALGWAQASCGAGLLLSNVSAGPLGRRFDRWLISQVAGYGIGLSLIGMGAALTSGSFIWLCTMAFFANGCLGVRIFCGQVQRRVALPTQWIARFAAIHAVANGMAAQAGNALVGFVSGHIDLTTCYLAGGVLMLPLTWATRWIPGWRELLRSTVAQAADYYVRRWPIAFSERVRPH